MKVAVVCEEVPAILRLSFPVHHPGAHGERSRDAAGHTIGWPMKEKRIELCGSNILQDLNESKRSFN